MRRSSILNIVCDYFYLYFGCFDDWLFYLVLELNLCIRLWSNIILMRFSFYIFLGLQYFVEYQWLKQSLNIGSRKISVLSAIFYCPMNLNTDSNICLRSNKLLNRVIIKLKLKTYRTFLHCSNRWSSLFFFVAIFSITVHFLTLYRTNKYIRKNCLF